jgi:hypothetical protein
MGLDATQTLVERRIRPAAIRAAPQDPGPVRTESHCPTAMLQIDLATRADLRRKGGSSRLSSWVARSRASLGRRLE